MEIYKFQAFFNIEVDLTAFRNGEIPRQLFRTGTAGKDQAFGGERKLFGFRKDLIKDSLLFDVTVDAKIRSAKPFGFEE